MKTSDIIAFVLIIGIFIGFTQMYSKKVDAEIKNTNWCHQVKMDGTLDHYKC